MRVSLSKAANLNFYLQLEIETAVSYVATDKGHCLDVDWGT